MMWRLVFSFIATVHLLSPAILVSSFGAEFLCGRIPGLTAKQREICEREPDAIAAIGEGTKLGLGECQHQFRFHRWNCTTLGNNFGHIVVVGSREAAFLYALSSAGVTYSITQACSRGNISSCGCAPPTTISTAVVAPNNANSNSNGPGISHHGGSDWGVTSGWRWGGCSADVHFAVKMARVFLDSREIEGDARSLMNLHNNKAGRKIVQVTLETECKCHGVSGSCTLKTCWLKLPTFRKIGESLIEKYKKAKPVVAMQNTNKDSQQSPRSKRSLLTLYLRPNNLPPTSFHNYHGREHAHGHGHYQSSKQSSSSGGGSTKQYYERDMKRSLGDKHKNKKYKSMAATVPVPISPSAKPKRTDLVFLDQSPNYCDHDSSVGSLGTRERRCERNASIDHSCDVLCCGRGYNTHQVWRKWKCNCKFRWCCQVECNDCEDTIEIYTCN